MVRRRRGRYVFVNEPGFKRYSFGADETRFLFRKSFFISFIPTRCLCHQLSWFMLKVGKLVPETRLVL